MVSMAKKGTTAGRPERERRLLAPPPAEEVPPPEGGEEQPNAAEQGDQRQNAPNHHLARRLVLHERLRRPVVGVRVVESWPQGRSRPRRPGEVRRELLDLPGILDRLGPEPVPGRRLPEVVPVVSPQLLESRRLRRCKLERPAFGVVAVLLEILDRAHSRLVGALSPVALAHGERGAPQIVGRVIRPQIGPVPEDGTVLHQAVLEENSLAGPHVLAGEDHPPARVHYSIRDRRLTRIRPVREKTEHEKAEQNDQRNSLDPPLRDQQLPPTRP
jgi:hypothetical protein